MDALVLAYLGSVINPSDMLKAVAMQIREEHPELAQECDVGSEQSSEEG